MNLTERAKDYTKCFISLKPLGNNNELGTLVWNYELHDSVWVLKKFASPDSMAIVKQQMARQMYVAGLNHGIGLPPAEYKAFLERTLTTTI